MKATKWYGYFGVEKEKSHLKFFQTTYSSYLLLTLQIFVNLTEIIFN